jgi:3-deoxy-D-manno-octulosonate 8-phosphate phosphatase (KDO 8-P phosphatase)
MAGLLELAAAVRLAAFDVDGVFTDGRIWLGDDGSEFKAFSVRDGVGVKRLLAAGIEVAVISGRASSAVDRRMAELGVKRVHQGVTDKAPLFLRIIDELGIEPARAAYFGDDTPDLPAMRRAGLPAGPADAHPEVRAHCLWTSASSGGRGAVREFAELLLKHRAAP